MPYSGVEAQAFMHSHHPAFGGKSLRLPEYPGTLVMGSVITYRSNYPLQGNTPLYPTI